MIAAAIIAKDEARSIERCLRSIAPYVDEIVLVDTGSTDGTAAIAAACGARVEHFAWCDDFAAARNFTLDRVRSPWRLILDADEWLVHGGEALRALGSAGGTPPFVGLTEVRNEFDDSGSVSMLRSWIPRVLPSSVRYQGRIHEQPVHPLPITRLDVAIGHDGYRKAQQEKKGDRNERLLRAELSRSPDDPYLHYQMGKEQEGRENYSAACACYQQARELLGWPPADAALTAAMQHRNPWLHAMTIRHLYSLRQAGRVRDALRYAEADEPCWRHSPDFHFALGDLLLDFAIEAPGRAAELLPRIETHWKRCLEIGETPMLDGSVAGRGSHLAAHNLAVFFHALGDAQSATRYQHLATSAFPMQRSRSARKISPACPQHPGSGFRLPE